MTSAEDSLRKNLAPLQIPHGSQHRLPAWSGWRGYYYVVPGAGCFAFR